MQGRKRLTPAERAKREVRRARRAERASPADDDRKRRHHYVWRHYLEAWGNESGQVWCDRRGARFLAATTNLGVRRDFYKLRQMSESDLQWVERLIGLMPNQRDRALARGWIPMFRDVFRIRDLATRRGITAVALDAELETAISNIEEDLHARIECKALPLLDALRNGEINWLSDTTASIHFFHFIGLQYMRTPRMASRVRASLDFVPGFDVEASWGLLRTIFGTMIGKELFRDRTSTAFVFLDAGPTSQFVTGDQPIVNLGSTDRVELYYPLTPKRSLVLVPNQVGLQSGALSDDETRKRNLFIRRACEEQVYAASEAALIDSSEPAIEPASLQPK